MGVVLILILYMYAYMAVLAYGEVALNDGLDRHANFANFPIALLTLFRCARHGCWMGALFFGSCSLGLIAHTITLCALLTPFRCAAGCWTAAL